MSCRFSSSDDFGAGVVAADENVRCRAGRLVGDFNDAIVVAGLIKIVSARCLKNSD